MPEPQNDYLTSYIVICYNREMKAKKTIAISEFKAKALALVSDVETTGQELVLTRRGVPVARVVPFAHPTSQKLGGSLKGKVEILGDLILPATLWGKYSS